MHGFIHAQAFHIRPVENGGAHIRHHLGIGQGDELDKLGIAQGLHATNQIRQRISHPRNHHRPAFHTAHAVNALFHGTHLEQILQGPAPGLLDQALNLHRPGLCFERVGVFGGIGFVSAKFVIVVVGAGVFIRRDFFHHRGSAHVGFHARQCGQFVGTRGYLGSSIARGPGRKCGTCDTGGQGLQQLAALVVHPRGRDLAGHPVLSTIVVGLHNHEGSCVKRHAT